MKIFKILPFALFLGLILGLSSCFNDDCQQTRTFYRYDPVYKTHKQIIEGLELNASRELETPGKIYVYNQFLLINEPKEGIHIFDNSNPSNPVKINFISIPGNVDLAVRENTLYADSYIDLLVINIQSPQNPILVCRLENVFAPIFNDPARGLLVDYTPTQETITLDCNATNFNRINFFEGDVFFSADKTANGSNGGNVAIGIGGSMARFTIWSDFLYTVDQSQLYSFNIQAPCPTLLNKNQIGWNIETIYPYQDKLFIGSANGMFIFELTNPSVPKLAGSLEHWRSCDPVVVQESLAYVTLHGGTECGGYSNQLDIIDVSNIYAPKLLKTYPLVRPLGLSVYQKYLFVCDEALKIFNVEKWQDIILIKQINHNSPYDLIINPEEKTLILVSSKGIFQYDISSPENPILLSTILSIH